MPHRRRTPYELTPIERELLRQAHKPVHTVYGGPPLDVELGAFGKKFVAFGLLLLAWRTLPAAEATGAAWIIPGFCLLVGTLGMIKGLRETVPAARPAWMERTTLRLLWAVRPRAWLLTWGVILAAFALAGSPHLRITYSYSSHSYDCGYLGINGWERVRGSGTHCPVVKLIPLR